MRSTTVEKPLRDRLKAKIADHLLEGPEIGFLVDLLKNCIVFLGIFLIAITLHFFVHKLEEYHYPIYLIFPLWLLENLMYFGDILWFGCFIVVSTYTQIVKLFKSISTRQTDKIDVENRAKPL